MPKNMCNFQTGGAQANGRVQFAGGWCTSQEAGATRTSLKARACLKRRGKERGGGKLTLSKYSSEPTGSAFMVMAPGCQEAGHTSPYLSTRVKDGTRDTSDFGDPKVAVRSRAMTV